MSAALRLIIRQWDQLRRPVPATKTVADHLRAVSAEQDYDLSCIPIINAGPDPEPDSTQEPNSGDPPPEFIHPPYP